MGMRGDPAATVALLERVQAFQERCKVSDAAMSSAIGATREALRNWRKGHASMRPNRQRDMTLRLAVMERLLDDEQCAVLRRMGRMHRDRAFRRAIPTPDARELLARGWGLMPDDA